MANRNIKKKKHNIMSINRKTKSFEKSAKVQTPDGKKCTVFVYGELNETGLIDGFVMSRIKMTRKGHVIREESDDYVYWTSDENATHAPVKEFNMGWAICDERDEFDREIGRRIAKKRFSKSPMKTQNGNFLTIDMCNAIVANECKYITEHIDKFLTFYKN